VNYPVCGNVIGVQEQFQTTMYIPHRIVIVDKCLETLTGVCVPNAAVKMYQHVPFPRVTHTEHTSDRPWHRKR
jgi:hypothetical protein